MVEASLDKQRTKLREVGMTETRRTLRADEAICCDANLRKLPIPLQEFPSVPCHCCLRSSPKGKSETVGMADSLRP